MTLEEGILSVKPLNQEAMKEARQHWDKIAKPLNSLGLLEEQLVQIAGIKGDARFSIENKYIAVMCADNGVVEEGVSQTGQEVTAIVAANMTRGISCVCRMAARSGAEVLPMDVGMACREPLPGLLTRKTACGTKSFLKGPAMTREEAVRAVEAGIEAAGLLKEKGCSLAGCGEMGIGNTTTASALISVFLGRDPEEVTGRGAGLSREGVCRKIQVIREGIRLNCPDAGDALDVLSKVGGFDLAALAGFYIGCGVHRIPVVLDGLITGAAALAAVRLCPLSQGYLLASHVTAEPAGALVLDSLGLHAPIQAGMCLGEGTGAAALFPLLDMAWSVYDGMASFEDIQVEQYRHYT